MKVYQFEEPMSNLTFADQTYYYPKHTLKLSIQISNWPFKGYNNRLLINMESGMNDDTNNNNNDDNKCINKEEDENGGLKWVLVYVGDTALYLFYSLNQNMKLLL